jgi:Nose resistant-to-fluoxetine protein, N-terminal domain
MFSFKLFEVFDASAKISSGILSGNINNFGDFDECLQARLSGSGVKGQYCLSYVNVDVPKEMSHLTKLKGLSHSLETFKGNFTKGFDDVSERS